MGEYELDPAGRRTAQVAGLGVQRPAVGAGLGPLLVGEERFALVPEGDLLDVVEGFDGRVFASAPTAPGTE